MALNCQQGLLLVVVTCEGLLPAITTKGMCVQNETFTNMFVKKKQTSSMI